MAIKGKVSQVMGAIVDVEFDNIKELPSIYNALEINHNGKKLVLEVILHLGQGSVRTLAMDATDGLVRGQEVTDTGSPITVPVGEEVLGRIMNVLGEPVDEMGEIKTKIKTQKHINNKSVSISKHVLFCLSYKLIKKFFFFIFLFLYIYFLCFNKKQRLNK